MNENDLREALRSVRPVEIDEETIAAVIKQAKARRLRVVLTIVGALVLVAVAATVVVGRYGRESVAVPDPRATVAVSNPSTSPVPSTSPSASRTTSAAPSASPSKPAATTYSGPTTLLPASFGVVKVKVTADGPAGVQSGYQRADAQIMLCGLTPSDVTSLRRLTAAATVVHSAGESYQSQSVLEFAGTPDAAAFVNQLRQIQATCPSGQFTSATRAIPSQVTQLADEGVVVGSYVPGTPDGSALYVGRKGHVVVVVMTLVSGDLAKTARSDVDRLNTAPILDVLSQS